MTMRSMDAMRMIVAYAVSFIGVMVYWLEVFNTCGKNDQKGTSSLLS